MPNLLSGIDSLGRSIPPLAALQPAVPKRADVHDFVRPAAAPRE